jgi:hypothetical protein
VDRYYLHNSVNPQMIHVFHYRPAINSDWEKKKSDLALSFILNSEHIKFCKFLLYITLQTLMSFFFSENELQSVISFV